MKKLIISFLLISSMNIGYSQLVVSNTNTVANYVQNVLLGSGVTVSNITFNGGSANVPNAQFGSFNGLGTSPFLGIDSGIVMATGDVNVAVGPNNTGSANLGGGNIGFGDPDLDIVEGTGAGTNDAAILEFDFIPTGDTVIFRYVFASEEYPEFAPPNGGVNDVFGFFLSGPGISGPFSNSAINIALIPGTTTPVTINNLNAITNAGFYIDNTGNTGAQSIQFDGYTTVMTAVALVQCGVQFHIKIAIADASDAVWDSGVFLEGGSFSSNSTISALNAIVPPNVTLCTAPYDVNFSAGPNPPLDSYWDFGDGIGTDTAANPFYTYADTGTYVVMYVAMDPSACITSDTAYFTVEILLQDSLDAQFIIPPYEPCTDSLTIQLNFTGTGADSLFWDMGNGTTIINDTSVTYTYVTPGTYIVSMEAYDLICGNTLIYTDTVFFNPVFTTVNATVPPNVLLCSAPYVVNFVGNNPAPPNSYWDFGDGVGSSTQANPSYTYAGTGLYNIMYVAIDSSTCNIADTVNFNVQVTIAPLFSATIDFVPPPPCGVDSFIVDLAFTGVGADSLIWDLGDGTQINNSNAISYLYSNPGTYNITLTAYNFLCGDESISNEVSFYDVSSTESIIPNVFTPNGDGMNDVLEFVGVDQTAEYSIQIFNRWGTKVYEGSDALAHWDGGNHEPGTYFYILKYTDVCSAEENMTKGTITLLK